MEIFVSVLEVAVATSCLVALLVADARDRRRHEEGNQ